MNECKVCNGASSFSHRATILGSYEANYYCCTICEYLHVEEPFWLEEAYKESINLSDTGLVLRNQNLSETTLLLLYLIQGTNGIRKNKYLDYGGGCGLFVRLMRDIGLDFFWHDKYTKNILACGFEDNAESYDGIVAFEVLEHLENPISFFEEVFKRTNLFICSTTLYGNTPPASVKWPYYGLEHGQHIGFYNLKTLKVVADQNAANYITDGSNVHVFYKGLLSKKIMLRYKMIRKLRYNFFVKRKIQSRTIIDHEIMRNKMNTK